MMNNKEALEKLNIAIDTLKFHYDKMVENQELLKIKNNVYVPEFKFYPGMLIFVSILVFGNGFEEFPIVLTGLIMIYVCLVWYSHTKNKKALDLIKSYDRQMHQNKVAVDAYWNNDENWSKIEFLPDEFKSYEAAVYMKEAIVKGKADSFKEAMIQYEQYHLIKTHGEEQSKLIRNQSAMLNSKIDYANEQLENIERHTYYY